MFSNSAIVCYFLPVQIAALEIMKKVVLALHLPAEILEDAGSSETDSDISSDEEHRMARESVWQIELSRKRKENVLLPCVATLWPILKSRQSTP